MRKSEIINILRHETQSAATARYGKRPPKIIVTRINQELAYAECFRLAGQVLSFSFLSKHLKNQNIPYAIRGATSNSFLLYLLGVTAANPLPPHYFCPHCKSFVWVDSQKDGYDLPPKICTCGTDMERDGHNLSWELFWGVDLDTHNLRRSQQTMNMDVPYSAFDLSCDFLRGQPLLHGIHEDRPVHVRVKHFGKIVIQRNDVLPEYSISWYQPVRAASVRTFVINHYSAFLSELPTAPQTFFEALRAYGIEHGTWLNKQEPVKPNMLSESIPVFYDDLYDLLLDEWTSKDAWREAEQIHFGQALSEETNTSLSKEQAEWCNRAAYLFPRAHAVEYILTNYRLHRQAKPC